jgi:hypothetical protein
MDTKTSIMDIGHGTVDEKSGPTHSAEEQSSNAEATSSRASAARTDQVPMKMKLFAVLLVTAIGFGSHWSSGVTGAMKSTLKKARLTSRIVDYEAFANTKQKLHINNAQYAVLEASEDFMKTALILVSGLVTDRIGGASRCSLSA